MSADAILEVKDLVVSFATGNGVVRVVDGVDLSLKRGSTLALVGESGCGKTMTAYAILRLVPYLNGTIDRGQVWFEGRDLLVLSAEELRRVRGRRIAMVFQEPMSALNPVLSVGEQIAEVLRTHERLGRSEARSRTVQLLERVGMPDPELRARDYPHQISGGMKQRVMIAMALACSPAVLIADEPTTALDVTIQAQILELIDQLKRETGMAVLLITHDLNVVAQSCDELSVMYCGQIVERCSVPDLFAGPLHPYARGLLRSIPALHRPSGRLEAIPGGIPDPLHLPPACRFAPRCELHLQLSAQPAGPALDASRCTTEMPRLVEWRARRFASCHFAQTPTTGPAASGGEPR